MTMENLIRMYRQGAITGYQLMIDCLHSIDPQNPELVLAGLPTEIHAKILEYAARYDPRRVDPGKRILPTTDQVYSAASWIREQRLKQSSPQRQGQA
jgi:hypothetical protein